MKSYGSATRRRMRAGRRDSGVVSVEAALVLPLFLLIVFGTIEFGMLFKDSIAVTSMVRNGARVASAEPRVATQFTDVVSAITTSVATSSASSVQELWIYDAGVNGFPTGQSSFTTCTACLRYTWSGSTFVPVTGYTWDPLVQDACAGDAAHTSVGIYVKANHHWLTGLFPGSIAVSDHAVMRLEPIPITLGCR